MMYFSCVVLLSQVRIENVIQVDGENVEEATGTSSVDCVACVVCVRPRIGPRKEYFIAWGIRKYLSDKNICIQPVGQGSVSQEIQNFFIRIIFAAKEDKMFESMR